MNRIDFSIFSYSPSIITNERINLGVLFHDANKNECQFEATKNWNRLQSFDDELNIEFVKDYINGIKKQLEPSLLVSPESWQSFIKRFVNEFKFSAVSTVEVEDKDQFITDTKRVYLRYDYPHKERIKPDEQKRYIKNLLKGYRLPYSTEPIEGKFEEQIRYDYVVENKYFKHFEFDNKNISRMFQSIHAWRDIASEMKDTCETIFIFDTDVLEKPEFGIAVKMLKTSAAEVLSFTEALELIARLNSRNVLQTSNQG